MLISLLADEASVYGIDSIPFLATSYDDAHRLYDAQKPYLEKELAKEGLVLLFSVPWPPQGIYAKREIMGGDVSVELGVLVACANAAPATAALRAVDKSNFFIICASSIGNEFNELNAWHWALFPRAGTLGAI